jgi:hypothetical protein
LPQFKNQEVRMTTTAVRQPAMTRVKAASHDHLFYSAMAVLMGLTVFVGFAPTYYLQFFNGGPKLTIHGHPFSPLVHVHGALFTGWVLLFIAQTILVARRGVIVHRKLGVLGSLLAVAMVIVGILTSAASTAQTLARGTSPPGIDLLAIMVVPIFDMIGFATFVSIAIALRRNKEAHKRLMVLAYVSLMDAAIGRIHGLPPSPFVSYGLAFIFVLAAVTYDFWSRGQVHKVYLWGGTLFAVSVPLRFALSTTAAWHSFAERLTK